MFKKLIGDKKFYGMVLRVGVPIMIQNGITNFVNLLDNLMVGRLGTEQMSGVSIANQLLFVFSLCIFGGISGPGIFGAQFFGKKDHDGIRHCFRYKFLLGLIIAAVAIGVFCLFDESLVDMYLQGEQGIGDPALTLENGVNYLQIMLLGLVPFAIAQVYSSTLREQGETFLPMLAGLIAVGVNLVFNWLLIFGNLGFPEMGVEGAAIATVISRFVEMGIVVIWTHAHRERFPFVVGAFKSLRIPKELFREITIKGAPLLLNEGLWSAGMAVLNKSYSIRSTDVIGALNISSTVFNIFNIVFMSFGTAISIVVGPMLGAGEEEKAVDTARKMIAFSTMISFGVGLLMMATSHLFPQLYNTDPLIRDMAASLIFTTGCCCPLYGFVHASYFTIRSGGKTVITFLFDSAYTWVIVIPLASVLAKYTALPIIPLYLCCQLVDIIKCTVAYILIKKRIWLNNLVDLK